MLPPLLQHRHRTDESRESRQCRYIQSAAHDDFASGTSSQGKPVLPTSMSSLLRFAQSAIQGANDVGSGGGYSHPAQHRHEPDLDAFADLEGDSDSDRGDDDGYTPTSIAAVSRREANLNAIASPSSSSSAAAAAAVRQQRAAPLHAHGGIPGGYDFEPQVERPRPTPLAAASARSSMSIGRSASIGALSRSRRASLSSQRLREELAGRYETASGEQYGQPAAFAVWRGLVNRLRGTAEGGGGGGAANGGNGTANGEEGHGLLFSQDDSEDPSDRDWPLGRAGDARDRNQYPPARDPHLPLPPRAPQFAPPPDVLSAGASDPPAGTSPTAAPRVVGRGQGHDGVFANLAAKPDNPNGLDIVGEGPDKEEILPVSPQTDGFSNVASELTCDVVDSRTKPLSMTRLRRIGRRRLLPRAVHSVRTTFSSTACPSATCSALRGTCSCR